IDAISLGALALYYMFKINVVLSIVSLSALLIVMVVGSIIGKKITKATDANFKAYGRMSDYVQEDFSGISVIKAFVKERLQMKRFQKYNQDNRDTTLNITKIAIKMEIIISVVLTLINLAIISYGAYLIWQKSLGNIDTNMDIGTLTEFLAYFDSLILPMMAIGRLIDLRSQGQASLNRISSVMNEEVEINDLLVDTTISTDEPIKGLIEYKNLEFSYPNSEIKVLTNVNFKVEAGEFVGIMGGTGVGKTTIVDLLLRIYNIEEGMLYIDGNDIMHLPIKYVRDNISYVPQDNFLFSKTIEDNISFSSDLNGEKKNVVDYAKLSDVDKDIVDFKEGYETILGERGVTVSGGQKQRISMARALYKDSSILVLDDSLSAVDTETEKKIINNLRALRKGKTTIIIAHRISTLQYLDKIVVVEDGTVTGVGTHDELVLNNEHYANEVRLQELEKEINAKEGGRDE
ncbi:MAG: ABC transporter ATP-binding protein, partial [Bacilli bacterium]|nr:ABC transporter ATP-binding protein [Bacilli bacterium]